MSAPPFDRLTAIALTLLRDDIDTDSIIPSREITSVGKSGLADGLFASWRYTRIGSREPDPVFALNQPRFAGARILLAGRNFGCGSSREHAAWALAEFGFRAVIAASFNPIFEGNATRNGIVPVTMETATIEAIAREVEADPQEHRVTVDLVARTAGLRGNKMYGFPIGTEARQMLLGGLDMIDLTLTRLTEIGAFVATDQRRRSWAYLK